MSLCSSSLALYRQDGTACTINVDDASEERRGGTYTFDRVFDTDSAQETVFEFAAKPVVEEVFNGFYATVFVYGQTGAGRGEGGGKGGTRPFTRPTVDSRRRHRRLHLRSLDTVSPPTPKSAPCE